MYTKRAERHRLLWKRSFRTSSCSSESASESILLGTVLRRATFYNRRNVTVNAYKILTGEHQSTIKMATDSNTLSRAAKEVDELLDDEYDCSDIEFLSRSMNRLRVLVQLSKAPRSQSDLQRELAIPRTTLRRNLIQLAERQWIEERPSENVYRILPPGEVFTESFCELLRDAETADRLASFTEYFSGSIPLNTETLRDCDITCCAERPYAPVIRFDTLLNETDSFSVVLPSINPTYADTIEARILDGTGQEVVVPTDVLETLRTEYLSVLDAFSETESARLFVSEETPAAGFGLLDNYVTVATYSQNRRMHSLLEASREQSAVVDWTERCYSSYKQTAEDVHLEEIL